VTGERLLLADDEDNLRSMLDAALRHSGFDVTPVATGREALESVRTHRPDLLGPTRQPAGPGLGAP
jgi:two-component system, OmpR family, response regulator